ncbi:hypothetical protein [Xanthobacter autotrophicus]|uniref:hypothetical protein n=1 Tax=Xanthobacter autotrophicus TaxID=280 RepID=UPI0024A69A3C|nr:hypothetical protein [Xanthobacter autotrophicus]MDI4657238.1 hypothetical protein [Xanthobacter autotrophicus]
MSEHNPSRRGFLGHVAGAYLASGALTAGVVLADPLQSLVTAYRDECDRLNAIPGNIPDDEPMPVWHAINGDSIPAATTKEGAMSALQLAIDLHEDFASVDAIPNLMRAALGFLEGATS